jgi:hypothetical protein
MNELAIRRPDARICGDRNVVMRGIALYRTHPDPFHKYLSLS